MSKLIAVIGVGIGIVGLVLVLALLNSVFLYLGWNFGLVPVLGLKEITLVQSFFVNLAAASLLQGAKATVSKS